MFEIKGRKIALIGGAGFIGHHLALELKKRGAEVHVVDGLLVNNLLHYASVDANVSNRSLYLNIINKRLALLHNSNIPLHVVDARDYHALGKILGQIKPQVIIHLAAVAHANISNKDPYSTFDHSLRTLENALDYARGNAEHFIYFSSSMVYGNFLKEEVDEDHPLNPMGVYGTLKLAGEKIVIAYNQVFGLSYTIVRPSALYGPGCVSRRVGQIFIENAMAGLPMKIEGDGLEKLDFTYVKDLVDGICLVIENPNSRNQIFNLTYGSARSVKELAGIVKQNFSNIEIQNVERDKLMPFRGTLSVKKARELLSYNPKHPVEVGMPLYIEWYKELFKKN